MHSIRKPIPGLYRAVKEPELASIKSTKVYSPGPYGDERKYFCPEIAHASKYAALAYSCWPHEGLYTMTSGYALKDLVIDNAYVDGGLISVIVENSQLLNIYDADEDEMCI